jgi:endonuclease/exonuclease/phosphatase family metal-dependent hydrolase
MPVVNILSLNAHMGFDVFNRRHVLAQLRDAIRTVSADLVFLQEVLGAHAGHASRHHDWPAEPQYEFLADTAWPQHAYGRNAVYPEGHHGNALLSRFPIASHDNRDISLNGHEPRGLLHCVIEVPGCAMPLHTLCVHLGLRESHRGQQLQMLCEIAADDIPGDAPLIIAGDFNDWRQRGHTLMRRCGLVEAFDQAHGKLATTFPASWPLMTLDRIYLRNAHARRAQVLGGRPWTRLSDHLPLAACIEF